MASVFWENARYLIPNFGNGFKVQHSLDAEEVGVVEGGHDAADGLLLVGQGPGDDVHFLLLQVVNVSVKRSFDVIVLNPNLSYHF